MHRLNAALSVVVLFSLAACAVPGSAPPAGYPRAYAVGFDDGCRSGKEAARDDGEAVRIENRRIDTDPSYARGYDDGYERCERGEKAFARRLKEAEEQKRLEDELNRGIPLEGGGREELEMPPQPEKPELPGDSGD